MKLLCATIFLASFMVSAYSQETPNEVLVSRHPDGRLQTRAITNEVVAMDTVVSGVAKKLREISNGQALVRLMMSIEDNILDCQVDSDPKIVKEFTNQVTAQSSDADLTAVAEKLKASLPSNVVTQVEKIVTSKFERMLDLAEHKTLCGQHHSEKRHSGKSQRRSARDLFIFPGTNWCGSGNQAEELGESIDTDMCCRDHDNCPYYIESMQQKYGYLNMRLYTISHCACDEQ
jgi:secretory phospholipase A2